MSNTTENRRRIKTCDKMIKARGARGYDPNDDKANLTDVLSDFRHWADARGVDFFACLDASYRHYLAEKE